MSQIPPFFFLPIVDPSPPLAVDLTFLSITPTPLHSLHVMQSMHFTVFAAECERGAVFGWKWPSAEQVPQARFPTVNPEPEQTF